MSSLPLLPMNIVNRILRDADILAKRKNIRRFIYNKVSANHEFRAIFRKGYLKKFAAVGECMRFKMQNPPQFTLILPRTVLTSSREVMSFTRNCVQTPEEREATVSRMRPAMIYKFPQKTDTDAYGGEMEYKYSYCAFDNGCVFIEKNTFEDEDDYYLLFYRGYICLDGRTFPIFAQPESHHNHQETPEQNPHGIDNFTEIRYLEKELGQKVRIPGNSQSDCKVFDEETRQWIWNCFFTNEEARFLVPFYEEPEEDYGYYSD
jgi:hypothetical protein